MFIPAIDDIEEAVELALLENEDETLARICIGHDSETDATYSVLVAMPKYLPHLPDGREIHFMVVEAVTEGGDELEYFHNDGTHTRRFLSGQARRLALSCICTAVIALADRLRPSVISMMTVSDNLPTKALAKYNQICAALGSVGYAGRRDSSFNGTQIWIMSRITDET